MRFVLPLVCLLLGQACFAQTGDGSAPPSTASNSFLPDVTVVVHKHPIGADMVQITMRASGYPAELLQKQIAAIGQNIHSEPRGAEAHVEEFSPGDPTSRFTKGSFAADGLIDRKLGGFKINEIVKAFANAPKPWTIQQIDLEFQGEVPTDQTIQQWAGKAVVCVGQAVGAKDPRLTGVEYRIKLLSQDSSKYDIPEPGQKIQKSPAKTAHDNGIDWTTIIVFVAAAGAVGVLVYTFLLRARPKIAR